MKGTRQILFLLAVTGLVLAISFGIARIIKRSAQIGSIRWEIKDVASGKVVDRGTTEVFPQDVQELGSKEENTAEAQVKMKSIHLNKTFSFQTAFTPETTKTQLRGFALVTNRKSPDALGLIYFKIVDDHTAVAVRGNSQLFYDATQINSKWQVAHIKFLNDAFYQVIVPQKLRPKQPTWIVTIFKGSYMDWSK